MANVAVVGARDTVLAFKALGLSVDPVENAEQASSAVFHLAQSGCAVIFVTEEFYNQIGETLERYKSQALPAILPIPSAAGATGEGMKNIRRNVEKAIGADILFKEEG